MMQAAATDDKYVWERYDSRQRLLRFIAVLATVVAVVLSWRLLDINYSYVATAPREMNDLFSRMYPPNLKYTGEIIAPLIETIHISILGTALAVVLSLPVAWMGANNTTPSKATYFLGKFIITVSRSVNVIIWALIFVIVFGPGALAGVLAVGVRSIGFMSKLLAESIEEIDQGQVEAVVATGASSLKTVIYGVIPQVKPAFVGITTYRWDINVRASTIIGFVGAGGIGMELTTSINYFRWANVLTILLAILGVVIFSEVFSAYMRRKVS